MMRGYENLRNNEIILQEEAFGYAIANTLIDVKLYREILTMLYSDGLILDKTTKELCSWALRNEDELLDWFYSGNYVKVKLDENGRVVE